MSFDAACGALSSVAWIRSAIRIGMLSALIATGLLSGKASAADARGLASVTRSALPPLSADAPLVGMATLDDRPIAFTARGAWQLSADGARWQSVAWTGAAPSDMQAVTGDGRQAFALVGASATAPTIATAIRRVQLQGNQLAVSDLPPFPEPLSSARATVLGDIVHVAGIDAGGTARLLRIDPAGSAPAWTVLPGWPGNALPSSLVAQSSAVLVGVANPDGIDHLWRWKSDGGWTDRGAVPGRIVPGSGRATGQAHVLYLVREAATTAPVSASASVSASALASASATPAASAPARLMTFHTITNAWAPLDGAGLVDASFSTAWKDGIAWAQTASVAGAPVRGDATGTAVANTPAPIVFAAAQIESRKALLRWLDWVVIIVYLGAMIGIGLYFYLREKRNSTANFFVGGRSIPFWAAGVSLYAANTSSISFIAIPAKAFESNWQYLTNNLIAVVGLMFVAVWIVPLLRRLDLMSVFSYLETRFHPAIRMLASALAILTQIGSRMSVILLLPALAISTITGLNVTLSIVLMGGFTIIYTAMGGMKAVIWTDFVQVIVKMGGAIFAIGFIIYGLRGGFSEFLAVANAEDKMHLFDFSFDLTKATVWGFIFLVLFDVVLTFPKDQVLMQRTLSTKSDKEAGRSIWTFAAIMIPGGFVFYMIGTALFVFYKSHPERMNPLLPIDATFPLFIGAELPMGVTGLIIAGIFAAAMATLSGIMNSVATLISVDFYDKLVKDPSQKKGVFFAEVMTVLVGLIGIGVAIVLSKINVQSLFDVSIELAGLLGGGFAGAYTLGMFTRRANSAGVAIGIASSIVLTTIAWSFKLVHPYFYLAISIALCIVIGYIASLFFPAPTRSLDGLTIYRDRPALR